uniref:Uncharacterized protein n=1 Tax=Anopheles atroparvus TaxID=41427 RepID=A0A182JID7_ANOAO
MLKFCKSTCLDKGLSRRLFVRSPGILFCCLLARRPGKKPDTVRYVGTVVIEQVTGRTACSGRMTLFPRVPVPTFPITKMLSAGSATPGADGKQQSPQTCSPRTAASASATGGNSSSQPPNSAGTTTVAMNNPTAVKLGIMDVPKALQDGEKFIKWDEKHRTGNVKPHDRSNTHNDLFPSPDQDTIGSREGRCGPGVPGTIVSKP